MNRKSRFLLILLGILAAANAVVALTGKEVPERKNVWEQTDLPARWKSRVFNMIGDGRRQEAILMLRNYLRSAPEDVNMRRLLGKMLFETGRYAEARKAYYAVLLKDPDDFVSRNNMGVILMKLGLHADARREFEDALDASGQEVFVAVNLAGCLELSGDASGAANVRNAARERLRHGGRSAVPEDALMLADAETIGKLQKNAAAKTDADASAKAREL